MVLQNLLDGGPGRSEPLLGHSEFMQADTRVPILVMPKPC
jgi:hypothetical protein